jgi:hypothetical protein
VARQDWRSNLWVFAILAAGGGLSLYGALRGSVLFGAMVLLVAGVAYLRVRKIRAGAVVLAVDAPGVFFGESNSSAESREQGVIPWALIRSVVICEILHKGSERQADRWMPAVGVRLDPDYLRHLRDQQAAMAARQPLTPDQRRLLDQVLPIDPDRNEVSACRLNSAGGWTGRRWRMPYGGSHRPSPSSTAAVRTPRSPRSARCSGCCGPSGRAAGTIRRRARRDELGGTTRPRCASTSV